MDDTSEDYTIEQAMQWLAQADLNFQEQKGNIIKKGSPIANAVHVLVKKAHLIVAAPELLETLGDCLEWMLSHGNVPPCTSAAEAAIAKATQ